MLLVLVVSSQSAEPTLGPFEQAAREVLGVDTELVIEPVAANPSDEEAVARAEDQSADGVVELDFSPDGGTVVVHCYLPTQRRWLQRSISFESQDHDADRGRLLGYAVASMYTARAEGSAPVPVPPVLVAPPPVVVQPVDASPVHEQPREAWGAVEFAAVGTVGVGGTAQTTGAAIAFEHSPVEDLWLRAGLVGRTGEIEAANATLREAMLAVGSKLMAPLGAGTEIGLRLDLLGGWLGVTHFSADDDAPARHSRWLASADLLAVASIELSPSLELRAAAGLEGTPGKTDVSTHGSRAATIPPLRLEASLGVGSRF
jgi:hypothetical protein